MIRLGLTLLLLSSFFLIFKPCEIKPSEGGLRSPFNLVMWVTPITFPEGSMVGEWGIQINGGEGEIFFSLYVTQLFLADAAPAERIPVYSSMRMTSALTDLSPQLWMSTNPVLYKPRRSVLLIAHLARGSWSLKSPGYLRWLWWSRISLGRGEGTLNLSAIILSSIPCSTGECDFVSVEYFEQMVQVCLSIYRGKANLL